MANLKSVKINTNAGLLILLVILIMSLWISLWGMHYIREQAENAQSVYLTTMNRLNGFRILLDEKSSEAQRHLNSRDTLSFSQAGKEIVGAYNNAALQRIFHTKSDFKVDSVIAQYHTNANLLIQSFIQLEDLLLRGDFDKARQWFESDFQSKNRKYLELHPKVQNHLLNMAEESEEKIYENGRNWIVLLFGFSTLLGLIIFFRMYVQVKFARKEREEQIAQVVSANKAKSAFLANMSHEIRTPLTGIIGFAELTLHHEQTREERVSAINNIITSGKHLLQIINDILDISKVEADKMEIEKICASPIVILNEVSTIVRLQAEEKGLAFDITFSYPIPGEILTDPLRIKQIILNLCSNAIKFTEKGFVKIEMKFDQQGQQLQFDIIDSGIGLTKQQLERVFDAFTQADVTTTRRYGGTGLGLSLSQNLATLLGGEITAESEENTGSKFSLTIPVDMDSSDSLIYEMPDELLQSEPEIESDEMENALVSGKILLVEDTLANQELVGTLLSYMGAEVDIASNGKIAVDMALQCQYDLILMDMQMPIMDGVEATGILRQKNYQGPIIALTANAMKQDKEECLSAGCDDIITKPVDQDKLAVAVKTYLNVGSFDVTPLVPDSLGKSEKLKSLQIKFVEKGIPEFLEHINQSFREGDWKTLEAYVHKLKGTGGNYGYSVLTEICEKIEFQIINKDVKQIKVLVEELNVIYARIVAGIKFIEVKTV